ncbi:MAG: PCI domain-containing protein, partial [Promethearchaeota archaeon]
TIILLQNICFILESKKIAVWITIELNKALNIEKDPEVKKEIIYTLKNIGSNFADIDDTIERINNELSIFQKRIIEFQKIPAQFREKLNSYIQNFKFNDTEIQLNIKYNKILKKIKKFDSIIKKFDYKRLAFELIEEWEETRVQIIEELSIIKSFISEICEEKKAEFVSNLREKINTITKRIDVLRAEFEFIKEKKFEVELDEDLSNIEFIYSQDDKLGYITQIRKKLFKLDGSIRELLIDNVEFNEIFKELLQKWVSNKIEIQEYLNDLDRQIKLMKDKLIDYLTQPGVVTESSKTTEINGISNELSFQLLQGHIQTIITERIEGMKIFNEDFDKLNEKLDTLIKKNEFSDGKRLIEINSAQIQNFIEESEKQIDAILGREKIFEDNNVFNLYIRPYLNKINASKELLINRLKNFIRKSNNKLYLNQIKYYLKMINPIKLDLLANYIKLDVDQLKDLVLKFISKNKLNAKIINEKLYFQQIESDITDSKEILFFKNIKTIGNEIYLSFKLTNPSNFNFKDLQISLKIPSYLIFQRKESFPKFLQINELKSGKNFQFNYVLKVDKQKELKKNLFDPSADEIKLDLYYRDQFDIARKTTKHIDLFIP